MSEGDQLNYDVVFFHFFCWCGERGSTPNTTKRGPPIALPAKRHSNGILLAGRWWPNNIECWLGSFWFSRGPWPVMIKNPITLWFSRGSLDPMSPHHLWICACIKTAYFLAVLWFVLFDLILHVPLNNFQLFRNWSSWVEPVLSKAQGHNTVTRVRLESVTPWSRVKHSSVVNFKIHMATNTTTSLHIPVGLNFLFPIFQSKI